MPLFYCLLLFNLFIAQYLKCKKNVGKMNVIHGMTCDIADEMIDCVCVVGSF